MFDISTGRYVSVTRILDKGGPIYIDMEDELCISLYMSYHIIVQIL